MKAQASQDPGSDDDRRLREELVSRFGIDSEGIQRIFDAMEQQSLGFAQAALRLGLVSNAQLDEARIRAHTGAMPQDPGLVEAALRKIAADRRIVLRSAEPVIPSPRLVIAHDPSDPRSERMRALRTELMLLSERSPGANVVAVLSPGIQEGRSQLAAELAIAFAQLGRRTLLVDADMRSPRQHVLFGATNEHGLSSFLTNFQSPIYHPVVDLPQMHLLTAGPIPGNPLELLSDGRFAKFVTDWRNHYEFLVIDTPSVSRCADGIAIATLARRVLVLSRAQRTPFKETRDMLRRLNTAQAGVLGAVLNHF